ncbi:MAG: hypothetical protein HZB11_03375 [Candidatus Yonathbacteria bacterium]|nr:hypothetical protein [Candidatus Yonathbacteria bacterium]
MFGLILNIILGILALVSAGAGAYTYLEQAVGPRATVEQAAQKKPVVISATSTTSGEKKAVVKTPVKTNGSLMPKKVVASKTIVTPGPLRRATSTPVVINSLALTVPGVIQYTNDARMQNGALSPLTENLNLDRDAQMKLDDMFAKQYFEHISPSGAGPADLANAVGYAYVIVGENLALGDFGSDQGVVTAWMNSPGHRANILKPQYQEIGVAVGKGMYEGHDTWIAVQSFGMPLSSCPTIDVSLKAQINMNNGAIARLRSLLDAKKAQIDATPINDSNYNVYVNEFNAIVPQYNSLVETNRVNVATYNAGVQAFNACISAASSAT